jgi:hypothetical protein
MWRKILVWGAAALGVALVAIQLVPTARAENPVVEEEVVAPAEVMDVLRRSCYDCHSNETRWPWYTAVAPAKWLVHHDVLEGREHLNFSTWNRYDAEERAEKLEELVEEVDEGKMPPWFYTPLHPGSGISEADRAVLAGWARQQAGGGRGAEEPGEHE